MVTKGKTIFQPQSCNACHEDGGVGAPAAPKLVGIGAKRPARQTRRCVEAPNREDDGRRYAAGQCD
ncbi:MAG: c-type cytochrome [Acidobacteria bacterium]|nr:c-type cytochrome [Acidobacteriota bacterium]